MHVDNDTYYVMYIFAVCKDEYPSGTSSDKDLKHKVAPKLKMF